MFFDNDVKVDLMYTYDTESVIKTGSHTFKVWIKVNGYKPNEKLRYSLMFYEIKCDVRQARVGKIIDYPKIGNSSSVENPNFAFEEIEPDSLAEMVLKKVCKDVDR